MLLRFMQTLNKKNIEGCGVCVRACINGEWTDGWSRFELINGTA